MQPARLARCPIVLVVALTVFVSGCLVVSGDDTNDGDPPGDCWTDCQTVEVCQTYCEGQTCTEECWDEESCETICDSNDGFEDDSEYFDEPATCYSDLECDEGRVCVGNECQPVDSDDGDGAAGLCQTCETSQDCVEDGALCLGIVEAEGEEPAETFCGRDCGQTGCPAGFECMSVDDGTSDQCVPEADADGDRTCAAGGDLDCVVADDCEIGEQCVDNECQPPEDAPCTEDGDCASGEVCEVFECVDEADSAECLDAGDCGGDEVCFNGECVEDGAEDECVFNDQCDGDEACVDGVCTQTCQDDAECGFNERCRVTVEGDGICEYIECQQSSDCSPGEVCVDAYCEETCETDAGCSDGYLCADLGYCEPDPDVECRSDAECAGDQACNADLECEETCTCNDDCASGEVCSADSQLCVDEDSADGLEC